MNPTIRFLLSSFFLLPTAALAGSVHHEIDIQLDPSTQVVEIEDRLRLPEASGLDFLLAAELELVEPHEGIREVELGELSTLLASDEEPMLALRRYRLDRAPGDDGLLLSYRGPVKHGLSEQKEEYTRGFRDSAGDLSEEGIYLAGRSYWYPVFGPGLVEFRLESNLPAGWHLISQGTGSSRNEEDRAHWTSDGPMDEIYLVGGPLERYRDSAGAVEALVYLHERDDTLANKYLETTAQYVEMYRGLIGPYPYGKFALVENFWETGFGMPSFTLLGPSIIRFPFILHSSYPHEILHNWWGNSVFVEWQEGNWSEGLTAYLADHLIQEQRGRGEGYRRDALQKYRNYARSGKDFPLVEFRSRHSGATEAVGYGKTLMVFHMLRQRLGDESFRLALARFYRKFQGERASFGDVEAIFSEVAGEQLGPFFTQWVERKGAPELQIESVEKVNEDGRWIVTVRLQQIQDGEPYALGIPISIRTEEGIESSTVSISQAEASFSVEIDGAPLALQVDPAFDLFRLLDPREIPPSIGQIFGAERVVAVLPDGADAELYAPLIDAWTSDEHGIEAISEEELSDLPTDRSVWIFGRENRWAQTHFSSAAGVQREAATLGLAGETVPFADHTTVVIRRHPDDPELAVGWITIDPKSARPGLARKLPHYGKYSYLAFEGEEPTNVVKGQWSTPDSPLHADLRDEADRTDALPPLPPSGRSALAELPPVFAEKTLLEHVDRLSAPDFEGRGAGTEGLERAGTYIAEMLAAAGLEPAGDDGTYFQRFTLAQGPDGQPVEVANVLGRWPGHRSDWSDQAVVLAAHYDHQGFGWPDVHQGDEGLLHPGADDNASGVAVLLELARALGDGDPPLRTLIFACFAGEETGLAGSRHWLGSLPEEKLAGLQSVVNLDTVGRFSTGRLSVLGAGTATEWPHIVRGVGFVTGIEARSVAEMTEASDQQSFIERGIPGVQLFTGAHEDYHGPGDTADKIDGSGLVKIATFTRETMAYLLEREEPLTSTLGQPGEATPPAAPPTARRVRIGTVPDFGFPGPGVRVDSVAPDSPAAAAGLQPGDVLLRLAGQELSDLRGYSAILKTLEAGQTVPVVVQRGEERLELDVTLEAR